MRRVLLYGVIGVLLAVAGPAGNVGASEHCGNGACDAGETRLSCPADCRRFGGLLERLGQFRQRRRWPMDSAGGAGTPADELVSTPQDVVVGDPHVNYANVEFTADGRSMVWFEGSLTHPGQGTVWHCGVDRETGELRPADGKGFRAFDTTLMGRANSGRDLRGSYYVGLDNEGRVILVRPTGPDAGERTVLSTPADLTRRALYPTDLPSREGGYVLWIKNERVAGGMTNPNNRWVELQYIDLANPQEVHVVERQLRPAGRGAAPMDIAFVRWFRGKPAMTFGSRDANGVVQVKELDLSGPTPQVRVVTDDPEGKIDPFPWIFHGQDLLLAGIGGEALLHVYARPEGVGRFALAESVRPTDSQLAHPGLAQSAEPIVWEDRAYAAYQINNRPEGASFWSTAFGQPGEIWLSTVLQSPQRQWRISEPSDAIKAEPEPYIGSSRVWVFYTAAPRSAGRAGPTALVTTTWHLRRAETPLTRLERE